MGDLVFFYGTECTHCHEMIPIMEKIEKEKKVKFERMEIWHNSANKKVFEKASKGACMSVPAFWNKKTGKFICGPTTYDKLKELAS